MAATALNSRRHNLTEFRDLFTALFRISDRDVQTRVLDAINGIVHDDPGGQCVCRKNRILVDTAAQTNFIGSIYRKSYTESKSIQTDQVRMVSTSVQATAPVLINSHLSESRIISDSDIVKYRVVEKELCQSESCEVEEIPAVEQDEKMNTPVSSPNPSPKLHTRSLQSMELENNVVIRKRKRAKKIPRVEKVEEGKSRVEVLMRENLEQSDFKRKRHTSFESEYQQFIKPYHRNAMQNNSDIITNLMNYHTPEQIQQSVINLETSKNVIEQMKHEWEISFVCVNGLYPIHKAILDNELAALKRQIYVLKFRKINIHRMLTDEDESPLQLAIKNNSLVPIVTELLQNDADVNELDKDSNTIIHMAMMYSDNPKLLRLLLEKVNPNILAMYNDNGNTALHIGVSLEKFFMCKTFLEFIDDKERLVSIGRGIDDRDQLLQMFKSELNRLVHDPLKKLNQRKQNIINMTNRTNGRTPLFLALSNRSEQAELMVLMLLTHLADPRIADFNGMDSVAFAMETYEVNRYNDPLEISTLFFEKWSLQMERKNRSRN